MIDWIQKSKAHLKEKGPWNKPKTCHGGQTPLTHPTVVHNSIQDSDHSSTDDFTHEPLDTTRRHIRLIRVQQHARAPCLQSVDDSIHCTISNFIADSAPPYIALSYTWGAPSPTRVILINGKRFAVRENLYHFLDTFKTHSHSKSYLWIDQLCIDQTNNLERNHQVGMMTRIYRRCTFVITWLDASAKSAAQELNSGKKQYLDKVAFRSLNHLLHNRYFTRLWIVQEVLLAPRVQIVCGNIWLEWDKIRNAIMALTDSRRERLPDAMWLFRMKEERWSEYTCAGKRGLRLSLNESLSLYSGLKCENYRDKVYGLLGLVHGDSQRPDLDYNKSLQVVYLDTVKILLAQNQSECTLRQSVGTALYLSQCMEFSKQDLKALTNMFRDISELCAIDAFGLKSSACPMSHWWWFESGGERYYYYDNCRSFDMREVGGAGQNLIYDSLETGS